MTHSVKSLADGLQTVEQALTCALAILPGYSYFVR